MSAIEYHGYHVTVTVTEENWGFASGQWRGSFRFWREGEMSPRSGTVSRAEKSAYDARQRALRIAKSFIDAERATERRFTDLHGQVLARH